MSTGQVQISSPAREGQIRIRQLKLLEYVATYGSLSAAADALHVSQPAVTMMLRELESAFGVALVARDRRGAALTSAGLAALERLRVASYEFEAAIRAARDVEQGRVIRLGALPLAMVDLLPRAVETLRSSGRLLRVVVEENNVGQLLQKLRGGELDCVIAPVRATAAGAEGLEGLEFDALIEESLRVACGRHHPFARRRKVSVEELESAEWVLPAQNTLTRRVFSDAFLRAQRIPPKPVIESSSFYSNLNVAAQSQFLAFAPMTAIGLYRRIGAIVSLNTALEIESWPLSFVTRESNRGLELIDALRRAVQQAAVSCSTD